MPESKETIIIVGAGLSGLSCALTLQDAGLHPLILEASDGPGGRVRTDIQEGFLLDRGFQVYLDAYPNAGALFDDSSLNLQPFNPGALVYRQGALHRVMDVFRSPQHLLPSLFAPVGSLLDKLQVARLRTSILKTPLEQIGQSEDLKTEEFLSQSGFSKRIIDTFFRAFYGGIFLERDLRTSSQMFEFTFKMFTEGSATLPAKGMGQLSEQLANRIPSEQICYQTTVSKITDHQIHLDSQEALTASHIVLATPYHISAELLPQAQIPNIGWRGVTNLYFSAPFSPVSEPIIILNGEDCGLVNNVAVLSDVSPHYAPEGQSLISVSLLGLPKKEDLPESIRTELRNWFGNSVREWKHLRTDRIPHALPEQLPNAAQMMPLEPPYYLCGDYCASASIEGAITSGQKTARRILATLPS